MYLRLQGHQNENIVYDSTLLSVRGLVGTRSPNAQKEGFEVRQVALSVGRSQLTSGLVYEGVY